MDKKDRLAQPEQESVACDCDSPAWCKQYKKCNRVMLGFEPYVAPPQREWQGLAENEKEIIWDEAVDGREHFCSQYGNFADAIEAKLKEKNSR